MPRSLVNFSEEFDKRLQTESWISYAVGMATIALRLYARARKLGLANLQAEDFLMIPAAALYTVLIITLNKISGGGGSNLYPPGLETTFIPADIAARIRGSKVVIVSEQAMLNVIYTLKASMLLVYMRLTLGLNAARTQVRIVAVYVALGYLVTQLTYFTACRPFSGYWAVPPPDPQCTTLEYYALVQGAVNISADVLMLGIPIPLVVRMRLPWRQKIVLFVIFSLGVFVVVAALLTKVFNLTDVYSPTYMLWYVREASVAVYVSNLPLIWPLLREWFPALRHLTPGFVCSRYTVPARKRHDRGDRTMTHTSYWLMMQGPGAYSSTRSTSVTFGGKRVYSLPPFDDIELAMAQHGLGPHDREESMSDEEMSPKADGPDIVRAEIEESKLPDLPVAGPPSLARALSKPKAIYDPRSRLLQLELQAKRDVNKGINVQTVVAVQEEAASIDFRSRVDQAMW